MSQGNEKPSPFLWIQFHAGSSRTNELRGEVLRDVRGFVQSRLDQAARCGVPSVMLHAPGGVKNKVGYAFDQRALLDAVPTIAAYLEEDFAQDVKDRGLTCQYYTGSSWQRDLEWNSSGLTIEAWATPNGDWQRELAFWDRLNAKQIWIDALAPRGQVDQSRVNMFKNVIERGGFSIGGEALALRYNVQWEMDPYRSAVMPHLVTETALAGFGGSSFYRVPKDCVAYDVMTPKQATASTMNRRSAQGFVLCPWDDLPDQQIKTMMKYNRRFL